MAVIKIKPVSVQSRGGHALEITGLDPTAVDCLVGTLTSGRAGQIAAHWDLDGTMTNGSDSANLDMNHPDLTDLAELAKLLARS